MFRDEELEHLHIGEEHDAEKVSKLQTVWIGICLFLWDISVLFRKTDLWYVCDMAVTFLRHTVCDMQATCYWCTLFIRYLSSN